MKWLLWIALAAATAHGADAPKTADAVMKFASAKMAGYQTWSASVRQETQLMGMPMVLEGQTRFKSPGRIRSDIQMPMIGALGKMLVVLGDDGWAWQEMDLMGRKQVTKLKLSDSSGSEQIASVDPGRHWESCRELMNFTLAAGEPIEGQPMWVLEGTWKSGIATNAALTARVGQLGKIRFHVGQSDGFTHRIEQCDKTQGKTMATMEFTNLKFNEPLNDALFRYQPPEGVEPIDITDMSRQLLQQSGLPSSVP
jgi:outer membrane lipoprotein-sorting protein